MASPKSHKSYKRTKESLDKQLSNLTKNLDAALDGLVATSFQSLQDIGQELYDKSTEICPKDTEDLVQSAFLSSERTLTSMSVRVGYKEDYAVFAHENSNRNVDYINPTTPGTHWKFLQNPLNELEQEIAERIGSDLQDYLR